MEIEINLDSFNKIYNQGEDITGNLTVTSLEKLTEFSTIIVTLIGNHTIKNNKVSPPVITTIKFFQKKTTIGENGKINFGNNNSFKFKINLSDDKNKDNHIYETYQGVLISNTYEIIAEINSSRGLFTSPPKKFNVYVPGQGVKEETKRNIIPVDFNISPQSIEKVKINQSKVPKFFLSCHIDSTNCDINFPFNGNVVVKESEIPIKSLELQFIRNESVHLPNGETITEISEIQNLQIGDGDVNKNVEIPLFMIFPRYFSCASLETKLAKVNFDVNIIVVMNNGYVVTENFPINTWRSE